MNTAIILGRLTKDPDVRYTNTGKCCCMFTLAVERGTRDKATGNPQADFIPVVVWEKPAEIAGNTLRKGNRLLVRGSIRPRSYDGKDGQKRYVTEIVADPFGGFTYIERRDGDPADAELTAGQANAPYAARNTANQPYNQQTAANPFGAYTEYSSLVPLE